MIYQENPENKKQVLMVKRYHNGKKGISVKFVWNIKSMAQNAYTHRTPNTWMSKDAKRKNTRIKRDRKKGEEIKYSLYAGIKK